MPHPDTHAKLKEAAMAFCLVVESAATANPESHWKHVRSLETYRELYEWSGIKELSGD